MNSIIKKSLAFALAFMMVFSMVPASLFVFSASAAVSGSGTQADPFVYEALDGNITLGYLYSSFSADWSVTPANGTLAKGFYLGGRSGTNVTSSSDATAYSYTHNTAFQVYYAKSKYSRESLGYAKIMTYYRLTSNVSGVTISDEIPYLNDTVTVTVPHVEGQVPSATYNNGNVKLTQNGDIWTGTLTAVASGEVTVTYTSAEIPKYKVNVVTVGSDYGIVTLKSAEELYADDKAMVEVVLKENSSSVVYSIVSVKAGDTDLTKDESTGYYTYTMGASDVTITVTLSKKEISGNQTPKVSYYASMTTAELKEAIFNAVVTGSAPEGITVDNVIIQYYPYHDAGIGADGFNAGMKQLGESAPADDTSLNTHTYYDFGERLIAGTGANEKVRITGTGAWAGLYFETEITLEDTRAEAEITYNSTANVTVNGHYGPKDEGLAQRIYDAIVTSSNHDGAWTVTVYDSGTLSGWRELDSSFLTTSNFAPGQTKQFRITWAATDTYQEKTIEVSSVKLVESRVAPTITLDETLIGSYDTEADFLAAVKAAITVKNNAGEAISATLADLTITEGSFPGELKITTSVTDSGATWIAGGDTTFTVNAQIKFYNVYWDIDGDGNYDVTTSHAYNSAPSYPNTNPTKDSTASTVYTFAGWYRADDDTQTIVDLSAETVTGEVTYVAKFTESVRTYTITWKNCDGTELKSVTLPYGADFPVYDGNIPVKTGDAQYSYVFKEWIVSGAAGDTVTGDVTYTPDFQEVTNSYTVTWSAGDGAFADGSVEKTTSVEYGQLPAAPETPGKKEDAQYTYTFKEWTPAINTVTGEVTYTATYGATDRTYTVTWYDEDGKTVLDSTTVKYGESVKYSKETPVKAPDLVYTYDIAGWDFDGDKVYDIAYNDSHCITADISMTAVYTSTYIEYTITWMNDGVEYAKDTLHYGDEITAPADPTKDADAEYTYTFDKWSPDVAVTVTGNATYTAEYTKTKNSYTITWNAGDGLFPNGQKEMTTTVEYGQIPTAPATPVKEDGQSIWSFGGWDVDLAAVTGAAVYTAEYIEGEPVKYTVTWYDEDGVTVLAQKEWAYGSKPDFEGAQPTKDATAQYTYTFENWIAVSGLDADGKVIGDASYKASYKATVNEYTVTWKNHDGAVLGTNTVKYGDIPAYSGATPIKAADNTYTYSFNGWDKELVAVTGNVEFTAVFTETYIEYTITWKNGNDVYHTDKLHYGDAIAAPADPAKAATAEYTYTFLKWTPDVAATVTGNATYTAVYTETKNSYKITWLDDEGKTLREDTVEYGTVPAFGANPEKAATAQYTYTFAGWDVTPVAVTGDATYTAKFTSTVNSYTVRWENADGSLIDSKTYKYGETFAYPATNPTLSSSDPMVVYRFDKWITEDQIGENNTVIGNVTFKATYTQDTVFKVIFNVDGTESVQYVNVTAGQTVVIPADPAKADWKFTGWTPDIATIPDKSITYTAQWVADINNNGVADADETVYVTVTGNGSATVDGATGTEIVIDSTAASNSIVGTAGDTDGSDGSASYLQAITVNGNAYSDGMKLSGGDKIVVTFATRSISVQNAIIYMNSTGKDKDQYVEKLVPGNFVIVMNGEGDQASIYLEMNTRTGWAKPSNSIGIPGFTPFDLPNGDTTVSKDIRIVWPAEGNLPQVIGTAKVVIKDSYRTVTYTGLEGDNVVAGTELGAEYTVVGATKTGHTLQYYTDASGKQYNVGDTFEITENVTLTAVWEANSYTVTWVDGNGKTLAADSVKYGVVPVYTGAIPTKTQTVSKVYTWNNAWDKEVVAVEGNVTYTATFTESAREYTISWDTDGNGTVDTTTQVAYGTVPNTPAHADRTAEDLSPNGWSPAVVAVTGDATYSAQYSNDEVYAVKFIVDGGEYNVQYINKTQGEKIAAVDAPAKRDWLFTGWTNADKIGTTPSADVELVAQWVSDKNNNGVADSAETGTVKLNVTGSGKLELIANDNVIITDNGNGTFTVLFNSKVADGNVVALLATPNDTKNDDGSVDYLVSADASVTIVNGQTVNASAAFGTEAINVPATGKIYINGAFGESSEKIKGLKDKILTAAFGAGNYNAADYTVYMVVGAIGGGIKNIDVETSNVGDQISMYTRFNVGDTQGFIIQKNGEHPVSDTISVKVEEHRLFLNITASQETIEFSGKVEVEGILEAVKALFTITTTDPETGAVNNVMVSDSHVTWAPDYAWPDDAQTKTFTVTVRVNTVANEIYSNAPSAKVTVTLIDTTILYTVKYVDGMGNVLYENMHAENTAAPSAPADPTRDLYTFNGWDVTPAQTVTGNVTYTAQWVPTNDANKNGNPDELDEFTVQFVDGNKVLHSVSDLKIGDTVAAYIPTEDQIPYHKKFSSWENFNSILDAADDTDGDNIIVYNVVWADEDQFTVTFDNNGKTNSVTVFNGDAVANPGVPSFDEDHDFVAWQLDGVDYDFTTPVTSDIILTAKWVDDFNHNDIDDATEAHYTIIYVVDGVENKFENVLVGINTPAFANPSKPDYKFVGWDPAVAATVTGDATYTAMWVNDTNNNGVDDSIETILITVYGKGSLVIGTLTVTNDGASEFVSEKYIYDSTLPNAGTFSISAVPVTSFSGVKRVSETYALAASGDGSMLTLAYKGDFSASTVYYANGSGELEVIFANAGFVYNENRVMNYYVGMPEVKNDAVYNAVVSSPAIGNGTYTIQYFARPAMSQTVNLSSLGLSDTIMGVLKLMKLESITIDMPELWQNVNVETDADIIEESVSLDQAVSMYLTVDKIESLYAIYEEAAKANGGLVLGVEAGYKAVQAEIDTIIANIKNAAMYYGAHNFGYNATDAETVTERIKITYECELFYIEGESTVDLKDLRAPSKIEGSNIQVTYRDYTDEDLVSTINPTVVDLTTGALIEGAVVSATDITDPYTFEGKYVSDTAYELTFKFAGNETHKPAEATFTITVVKADAKLDIPNVNVDYGDEYTMLDPSYVTLGNKYGDPTEITDSVIEFIIGLDLAELDLNQDGVTGLTGKIQLRLPADLQNMLDGIIGATGGSVENGVELTLDELLKYLAPLEDSSLTVLKQALEALSNIAEAGDIVITLGGDLPKDTGAYLYGAVSTSSNYATAFDVTYIIIKPKATEVFLDWNYKDTNGIFTWDLLEITDLGATAFDDNAFTSANADATALVNNVFFGIDENGELVTKLVVAGGELVEGTDLGIGAFTQLAFVAEFGNELYYAVPIVRAFAIVPTVLEVEIVDKDGNKTHTDGEIDTFNYIFDNTAKEHFVIFEGEIVEAEVNYIGIKTNFSFVNGTETPVGSGAYVAYVIYTRVNEAGDVTGIGIDTAIVTVKPTDSSIEVTGGSLYYDGEGHTATVVPSSSAEGFTPNYTLISGNANVDMEANLTLDSFSGSVNIDFPAWLDAALSGTEAFKDGVTPAYLIDFINSYRDDALNLIPADRLEELGISKETLESIIGGLDGYIDQLIDVIGQLPEDVTLTFEDDITYTEPGYYGYFGIVTDSDHNPSTDTGLLHIKVLRVNNIGIDTFTVKDHCVTVTSELPCKVGYLVLGSYVAVEAVANPDGTYSFNVPEWVTDVVLLIKGDVNGDGRVRVNDASMAKAIYLKKETITPTAEQIFAADANEDGNVRTNDASMIKSVFLQKYAFEW